MDFISKNKIILSIIVVLIIGFVVYVLYFADGRTRDDGALDSIPALSLGSTGGSAGVGGAGVELLRVVSQLRGIRLSDDLFSSEEFKSLVDFDKPISPEPIGRTNPFLPVNSGL